MLSPDGKWVWDGAQWQPIAHHETLFPSWQSAVAVASAAPVPAPIPIPTPAPTPAVVQPVIPALSYPQTGAPAAPLWKREPKQTGMNYAMYFAAGAVGIVIILIVLNSVFPLWLLLPGPKGAPAPPAPKASPLPELAQRSDYARADYFVSVVWPSLQKDLQPALVSVSQQCTKQLTNSCQSALSAAEPLNHAALAQIQKASVPLCIAPQWAKLNADIVGLGNAMAAGDKAYTDNQGSELYAAMYAYRQFINAYNGDLSSLARVAKSQCDPTVTGP